MLPVALLSCSSNHLPSSANVPVARPIKATTAHCIYTARNDHRLQVMLFESANSQCNNITTSDEAGVKPAGIESDLEKKMKLSAAN